MQKEVALYTKNTETIINQIAKHTVIFCSRESARGVGSGVFCQINNDYGILTALHVVFEFYQTTREFHPRLNIFSILYSPRDGVSKKQELYTCRLFEDNPYRNLHFPQDNLEYGGRSDILFIKLLPNMVSDIMASQSFYKIPEKRIKDIQGQDYLSVGMLGEHTKNWKYTTAEQRPDYMQVTEHPMTDIEILHQHLTLKKANDFCIEFYKTPTPEEFANHPKVSKPFSSFGGMSGCGIWEFDESDFELKGIAVREFPDKEHVMLGYPISAIRNIII